MSSYHERVKAKAESLMRGGMPEPEAWQMAHEWVQDMDQDDLRSLHDD